MDTRIPTLVFLRGALVALPLFLGISTYSESVQAVGIRSVGGMSNDLAAGAVPGPGVTGDACAYSIVNGGGGSNGAAGGAGNFTSGTMTIPPAAPAAVGLVACNVTTPRGAIAGFFLGPVVDVGGVGDIGRAKLPAKTVTVVSSSSFGGTTAVGTSQWTSVGAGPSALRVNANVAMGVGTPGGIASAESKDPFSLPAGQYAYAPVITDIELEAPLPGSYAILGFDAEISLVGAPLWELDLGLTGEGLFDLAFTSHPMLLLDDSQVEADLLAALDFSSPGIVSLKDAFATSGYTLFDSIIDAATSFTYSDTVRGRAMGVPEPMPLALLSLGLLGLVGVQLRRCRIAR